MLIECYSKMFSMNISKTFRKMFLKHNIFFFKHFKNVFKMFIANVFEKFKIKLFKKRPLLDGYVFTRNK